MNQGGRRSRAPTNVLKHFVLWGSLIKKCVFSLVNTFIIESTHKFIASYVCYTKCLFQCLTHNNNMKLCKGKYEPKVPPTTPCILKRRNGWMIIPIHPCLSNIFIHQLQATSIMPHVR
jgi:hypothetical protein